jgi:PTS system mannose-specific IIA component
MSVGILMVTHEQLGAQLGAIAATIFDKEMPPLASVAVPANISTQQLGRYAELIHDSISEQDNGAGVLVLTDVFGATPDNLARYFAEQGNVHVISGVNLPMLLRVLNYAGQSLPQLCETAESGGRSGIRKGHVQPAEIESHLRLQSNE